MNQIMECVPNFSEGRNREVVEAIVAPFKANDRVKLLDVRMDEDHNRSVVTVIGEPEALRDAVVAAMGVAVEKIDLRSHRGQHPRMGAADVVPFIPVRNCTIEDARRIAGEVARTAAERYDLPIFLYEKSATAPHRENLASVRKGEFEGMAEKMRLPEWQPDYGPNAPHPTAGVSAVGARMPLIAYNINLDTDNVEIAKKIAHSIRYINGGFRYCKALGLMLDERKIAQVSINLTDFTQTPIFRVFETVRLEAQRYGVNILGSEIVGMVPMQALIDSAEYYLRLEGFASAQVLESRL